MRRPLVLLAAVAIAAGSVVVTPRRASAVPAGWKPVRHGAVSFAVPSAWPVHDLAAEPRRCARLDRHAVYLGRQGADAACPATALGRTEAVQVQPLDPLTSPAATLATRATTVGGQPARLDPSADTTRSLTVALDRAGALLTVSYGADATLARRVLGTVRVDPAGRRGLAAPPARPARRTEATPSAVPRVYTGRGFDTCAAPSTGAMSAWRRSSPYRALGVYIGGSMRACGDGNLSATWIRTVTGMGWHLIPIYVGLQAPCAFQDNLAHIDPARAATQGTQAAADAVARAGKVFGLGAGTPVYFDMEAYDRRQTTCVGAVLEFLSAWTAELHRRGYRSGVYSSAASGVTDLVASYDSETLERPDYIWFAHWNGSATTESSYIPSSAWSSHQRIAQYRGPHDERWGEVTINIDSDYVDSTLVGPPAPPV